MTSPVSNKRSFKLPGIPLQQFVSLGSQSGNRGVLHTVFMSKKPLAFEFTVEPSTQINGVCSYAFLTNANSLCGFVVSSPASATIVKHSCLVIGGESEEYQPRFHLQPQGVILFESLDSNLIFVSLHVESPLLVKVDL